MLGSVLTFSSCNSDSSSEDDETTLDSRPLVITEAEFAAARYKYSFVTQGGQLINLTPIHGGIIGGDLPATMEVVGTGVSTPVLISYQLDDPFLDPEEEGEIIEGIIVIEFEDLTDTSLAFFKALGVTIEAEELPVGSAMAINLLFLNPDGKEGHSASQTFGELATVPASWTTDQGSLVESGELTLWIEGSMLQGGYIIERNL